MANPAGESRRIVRRLPPSPHFKFESSNQPEAQDPGDDQKDRHDVIEQPRHDQDEDAGEQRNDRLKVCDAYGAYGHFLIPSTIGFSYRRRSKSSLRNFAIRFTRWFAMIGASVLE
jgi:hypothetical protein